MSVVTITSPTEFRATLGSDSYQVETLVSLTSEAEREVRQATSEIFDDLGVIDTDEPGMVSAYLNGIEGPLETINSLGLQLVAHVTSGTMRFPPVAHVGATEPTTMPWRQTVYFVASVPCYFRAEGQDAVHVLGADCEGVNALSAEGARVKTWASREVLDQAFEGATPLCDVCFLHALGDNS